MTEESVVSAVVFFPDAPYTASLIKNALKRLGSNITIHETMDSVDGSTPLLQWATYDSISHELTLSRPRDVLTSSYVIRKSLIRKHFLHRAIQTYLKKNPQSRLNSMVPATWDMEISHSDELDEMWADELYELGQVLPEESGDDGQHWYILKPGMADRGMGIRLFRSKHGLQRIFDSFEDSDDESKELDSDEEDETGIVTSQLRHFVIQVSCARFIRQTIHSNTGISSQPTSSRPSRSSQSYNCSGKPEWKKVPPTSILRRTRSIEGAPLHPYTGPFLVDRIRSTIC